MANPVSMIETTKDALSAGSNITVVRQYNTGSPSENQRETIEAARTTTDARGAKVTTQAQAAATGARTTTRQEVAGFAINFSIPIRGGLNAGAGAPQNL